MFTLLLSGLLMIQQPETFTISVAGGAISGTETFTLIAMAQGGWKVTGSARITRGAVTTELVQDALFPTELGLGHYRLTVNVPGAGSQMLEAWREGDTIRMRASAAAVERTAAVAATPRLALLDNLVVSHFQLLLMQWARLPAAERDAEWRFLVPQALTTVTGRLTAGALETDTLDRAPIVVRRYTLDAGGNVVELWAGAEDDRLLQVTIPVQRIVMTRAGFVAAAAPAAAAAPCDERDVAVESGPVRLPGTYCAPRGARGPVPVVVLVAGSGPNDRDGTVGPNTPLRDIAWGLAVRGIASLRYDKRTVALRGRLDAATLTVQEEVIDDAAAAVRLARTLPGADPARVFLAGHSLGGTLAPLVAEAVPGLVRGLALLAPGARPLDSVVVEQTAYRLRVADQPQATIDSVTAALAAQLARVRSGAAPDGEPVLGASARYWRDLFARRPLSALERSPLPVLVLQGTEDYQVTADDFARVEQVLARRPRSAAGRMQWLPGLNHLFMRVPGGGPSTGAEYGRAGTVAAAALDALAQWVSSFAS